MHACSMHVAGAHAVSRPGTRDLALTAHGAYWARWSGLRIVQPNILLGMRAVTFCQSSAVSLFFFSATTDDGMRVGVRA